MQSGLKVLVTSGLFIVPFLPVFVTGSLYFPYVTEKVFAFQVLMEIVFLSWLVLSIYDKSVRLRFSWILISIGVFLFSISVSSILGTDLIRSLWGNFERMEGIILLLHLFVFFLVAGSVLTKQQWTNFFRTSICVSGLFAFIALLQVIKLIPLDSPENRVDAFFGNPTFLAGYLLFHIFFTLSFLTKDGLQKKARYFFGGLLFLELLALYFTESRGAILGVITGFGAFAVILIYFERSNRYIRFLAVGLVVFIGLLIAVFFTFKNHPIIQNAPVFSRFSHLSIETFKLEPRYYIWEAALKGIKEKPALGWGQGHFSRVYDKYFNPALNSRFMHARGDTWIDRAHNTFLEWGVAGGVLGLLTYLSIYLALIYTILRHERKTLPALEKAALLGLISAYAVQNLVSFDTLLSYVFFFALAAFLHYMYIARKTARPVVLLERIQQIRWAYPAFVAVGVSVVFVVLSFSISGLFQAHALAKSLKKEVTGEERIELFEEVLNTPFYTNPDAVKAILLTTHNILENDTELSDLIGSKLNPPFEAALDNYGYDVQLRFLYARFLRLSNQPEAALNVITPAVMQAPTKQDILFEQGLIFQALNNMSSSTEVLTEAFYLEPEYDQARLYYAISLIYTGEIGRAKDLLNERHGRTFVDSPQLVQAYIDIGAYQEIIPIFEYHLLNKPMDYNYRISLSAAYLATGNRSKAIEELQEMQRLHPEFERSVSNLIEEIRSGRNPVGLRL